MKLELIEKKDADGNRFQIRKDGSLEKSVHIDTDKIGGREVALKEATEYFERLKVPVEETIILSETI